MLRLLTRCLPFLLAVPVSANWGALNTGLQSHRSITTFGNDLYVAAYPTGIHKSTDDGDTWSPVNTGLPVDGSGNIFARSVGRSATHLFAGTQSGIYRSNTGGASWELANGSLAANNTIYANKIFTFGTATFAVFTGLISQGGGVYRTTNNGTSWQVGHNGMSTNMRVYHLTYDGFAIYAGTNIGIYRSVDLGLTWQQWGSGVNLDIYAIQVVGSRVHIISGLGYRFTENGNTWTNSTGTPTNPTAGELISYNGYLYALTNSNTGCLISMNNGVSYAQFNTGLQPVDVLSHYQFHATGTRLYMGALFDVYWVPGSTVGAGSLVEAPLVPPYPTAFMDGFFVDVPVDGSGHTVVLIDAAGLEALRQRADHVGPAWIGRGALMAGRYHAMLVDPLTGRRRVLGQVIAQ